MKYYKFLIWIPQFGIAIASPIVLFVLFAVWLQNSFGLGSWILIVCIALGIYTAFIGARDTIRSMELFDKKNTKDKTIVCYNQHS